MVWIDKPTDLLKWLPAEILPKSIGGTREVFPTLEELDKIGR
jgi:hypothetical protein